MLAVSPIGALFGALAVGRDLSPTEAVVMSAALYAGASQFVAIDLVGQNVPLWSIVLSVLAVNFRLVLYSAALTPLVRALPWRTKAPLFFLLVDPVFAHVQRARPGLDLAGYFGMAVLLYVAWVASTVLGVLFGQLLDDADAFAVDMLLPIYFLALVMGFRSRPNWLLTVAVSAAVAAFVYKAPAWGLTFLGSPWHVTIGGVAGILAAILATKPPRREPACGPVPSPAE